jgi:hypothetical protein
MEKAFSSAKITGTGTTILVAELSTGGLSIVAHTPRPDSNTIETSAIMLKEESVIALKDILKTWKP